MKVFVIDDNRFQAQILTKNLISRFGWDATMFTDPFLALQAILSDPPDVLVVDMMMPRIDGLTLLREVRKAGIHIPAAILSAHESVRITEKLLPGNRVKKVLTKNGKIEDVCDELHSIFMDSEVAEA